MGMEFGWWKTTQEDGKFQIVVNVHGGNIEWSRKQGHHAQWVAYGPPDEEDWDRLIFEAEKRVPRRLISPKQFAAIKALRPGCDLK